MKPVSPEDMPLIEWVRKGLELGFITERQQKSTQSIVLANPDFRGLVEFNADSAEAKELATLTGAILRPENPESAPYTSARDILRGIGAIREKLGK